MNQIEAIINLNKIFKEQNWVDKDKDEFVFNNFCRLLSNLEESERELIIELTKKYKWISVSDYQNHLLDVLQNIPEDVLNGIKRVFFFPIMKPEDQGKVKSSLFLLYMLKSQKNLLTKYEKKTFKIFSDFNELHQFIPQKSDLLFLVDDFIGSGETLNFCLEHIKEINEQLDLGKVAILSLASQKDISVTTQKKGIKFYSTHYCDKGLSDYYKDEELKSKLDLMLKIEKMIPGASHFSLGYEKSEALITLSRTPDNTFPIFWKEYRKGNTKFAAPFSRSEDTD